jgi:hypothetical protein
MAYAIKNKKTGLYFAGFSGGEAVWDDTPCTYADRLYAQTQADALRMFDRGVQRKPVQVDN